MVEVQNVERKALITFDMYVRQSAQIGIKMKGLLLFFEEFTMVSVVLRLVLALVFGGIVGMERSTRRQAAGLRTFALVCVGSALTSLTNQYMIIQNGGVGDPARLAAQVISGIGFLGVGTIIITGRNQIKGLTTAASLWVTATMGIALGIGFMVGGFTVFILMLVANSLLYWISSYQSKHTRIIGLYIEINKKSVSQFLSYLNQNNYEIKFIEKTKQKTLQENDVVILLEVDLNGRKEHKSILSEFSSLMGINYVEEM